MCAKLLNLPGCVNCYHEDGLDFQKCVATYLNGVLLYFTLYSLECWIYCNQQFKRSRSCTVNSSPLFLLTCLNPMTTMRVRITHYASCWNF